MGSTLAAALGGDYVPIALSTASGTSGMARGEPSLLPSATPDSLEFPALGAATDWIFLDRAALAGRGPLTSLQLTGSSDHRYDWARFYDGAIVFGVMSPNVLRPGCERL